MNTPGTPSQMPSAQNFMGDGQQQNPFENPQFMKMMIESLLENCAVKSGISAVAGYAFGGAIGLFMSGMDYHQTSEEYQKMSGREQIRYTLKDMKTRFSSSAKNMAVVGAVFAGSECVIEGYRAKTDLYNGVSAGCFTGAVMAAKSGPQAALFGCAGFSAFSLAIDYWMRRT